MLIHKFQCQWFFFFVIRECKSIWKATECGCKLDYILRGIHDILHDMSWICSTCNLLPLTCDIQKIDWIIKNHICVARLFRPSFNLHMFFNFNELQPPQTVAEYPIAWQIAYLSSRGQKPFLCHPLCDDWEGVGCESFKIIKIYRSIFSFVQNFQCHINKSSYDVQKVELVTHC